MLRLLPMLLAACALMGATASAAASAPVDRVRLERTVVPLPDALTGIGSCVWTVEGSSLMCIADVRDEEGRQVVLLRPDGSDYRCLTCAPGVPGGRRPHKLAVFPDGRRVLVGTLPPAEANADEGASLVSSVGECTPSVLDCQRLEWRPVALPSGTGSLNDREIRLSPDGRKFVYTIVRADGFLVLMGDLVRAGEGYEVRDARVLNAAAGTSSAADLARRGAFAEAKSFSDGRRLVIGFTEDQGSNLDVYRIDLASGARERVTFNGEWDEDAEDDPRGRFLTIGSARRNFNTLRGATVVPTPPFLDQVKTVFFARFKLANPEERRRALEAWLSDPQTERAGGLGRQLSDLRGGWDARMPIKWSPDGTRIVFYEFAPPDRSRLVVVRLAGRRPGPPHCASPEDDPECITPTPTWAPLLSEYPPLLPGVRVVPGPGGGQAILRLGGIVAGGELRVDYQDYTSADGLVLNGFESVSGIANRDFRVDLRGEVVASGRASGRAVADVFGEGRQACGTVQGQLGDRFERTYFGRNDPLCGFAAPPACGNRRDDDGDGLEDLTDRGCRDEEDTSEAGLVAAPRCVRRVVVAVKLRRGERVVSTRARIGGRARSARVVKRGRVVVGLRVRRAGRARVIVRIRTSRGRVVRVARTVRVCPPR